MNAALGCRYKANFPYLGPGSVGGVPSIRGRVFLRDPNPYLSEFWWKPRKTPNGYVDKHDREQKMNAATLRQNIETKVKY